MRKFCFQAGVLLAGVMAAAFLANTAASADDTTVPPPAADTGVPNMSGNSHDAGMEVMTRGPIHEAFAQPINSGTVNQLVVPEKPPEAIEEIPPDEKPADESTIWIGGYWAWNDDRQDFDWVSGVWRVPPPNEALGRRLLERGQRRQQLGAGLLDAHERRERGLLSAAARLVGTRPHERSTVARQYLDPRLLALGEHALRLAAGPLGRGTGQLDLDAGLLLLEPAGWVFCTGYWDYALDQRGLLFAPVSFTRPIFLQRGYTYSPSVVLDSGLLTFYLFARPSCSQYYFGDYYATNYDRLGIYPWFAVGAHRGYAYDPLFSFYSWRNAGRNPNWASNLRGWYTYYRAHPDQRLPHTLTAAQRVLASGGNRADRQFLMVADTLQNVGRESAVTHPPCRAFVATKNDAPRHRPHPAAIHGRTRQDRSPTSCRNAKSARHWGGTSALCRERRRRCNCQK